MSRWNKKEKPQEAKSQPTDEGRGRWHKKEYTREEARELAKEREDKAYDRFADMLIKKLETFVGEPGEKNWEKPWFDVGLQWPKALYGKNYNGMNALMLTMLCEEKGYQIPVFATSDRLFSMNYMDGDDGKRVPAVDKETGEKLPYVHILKGESAFPVFLSQMNIVHEDTKEKIPYKDYVKLSPQEQAKYNVYHFNRVYPVFNIDQTNLKEARPELYQKLLEENGPRKIEPLAEGQQFSFEPVDKMIKDNLWICPIHVKESNRAYFSFGSAEHHIVVPLKEQFRDGASFYGTLFHELTHSTGDEQHLNRIDPTATFGSPKYAQEECVAETGKALLCQRYGIPTHFREDTLPYLESWLKSLREEPKFIKNVLNDVKAATSVISIRVDEIAAKIKEDKALDLRDDHDDVSIDEEGNTIDANGQSVIADKKQGEEEGQQQNEPEQQEHRTRWRR